MCKNTTPARDGTNFFFFSFLSNWNFFIVSDQDKDYHGLWPAADVNVPRPANRGASGKSKCCVDIVLLFLIATLWVCHSRGTLPGPCGHYILTFVWCTNQLQAPPHPPGDHGGFDRFALPGGGEFDHKVGYEDGAHWPTPVCAVISACTGWGCLTISSVPGWGFRIHLTPHPGQIPTISRGGGGGGGREGVPWRMQLIGASETEIWQRKELVCTSSSDDHVISRFHSFFFLFFLFCLQTALAGLQGLDRLSACVAGPVSDSFHF